AEAGALKLKAAGIYSRVGQLDKAESLVVESLTLVPETSSHWSQLATIRQRSGNLAGAIVAQEAHLRLLELHLGANNPALISTIDQLISLLTANRADASITGELQRRRRSLKDRLDGEAR